MAERGQTIHNPVTGEHITFLHTSADTGGRSLLFDCRVEPGKPPLAPHLHVSQDERLIMQHGRLSVRIGEEVYTLLPGQSLVLPARIAHQWWNPTDEEARFRVEVTPARNLEVTLEAMCGLATAGKLNEHAMPTNPFHLAQLGKLSETYLPTVPGWRQQVGLTLGSVVGRVLGYDPTFAAYRTPVSGVHSHAA